MTTNPTTHGGHTNTAPLRRVLVYPPVPPDATVSWEAFGYLRPLDHERAVAEHAAFQQILADAGLRLSAAKMKVETKRTRAGVGVCRTSPAAELQGEADDGPDPGHCRRRR